MKPKRAFNNPLIRKGRKGRASVYAVAWVDLLGYGSQIGAAGLNPVHAEALIAQQRLKDFSGVIERHSAKLFPSLVMNDGAVFYRHLSFRSRANLSEFIHKARRLYFDLRKTDSIGARMVISVGFRGRGTAQKTDDPRKIAIEIVNKIKSGKKSIEKAVLEALLIQPAFNQVYALNSNYAFTKSYLVDSMGSKRGFVGPALYIEKAILKREFSFGSAKIIPADIFGRSYDYVDASDIQVKKSDVTDTLTIAKYLANSEVVFLELFGKKEGG